MDVLVTPISPRFDFTASLAMDRSGVLSISRVFHGRKSTSRPGWWEFLHMYLSPEESNSLHANMNTLILGWAQPIVSKALNIQRNALPPNPYVFLEMGAKPAYPYGYEDPPYPPPAPELKLVGATIEYSGSAVFGCWTQLDRFTKQFRPENQMMFVVVPSRLLLHTSDGLTKNRPLNPVPVVVSPMSARNNGLARGVKEGTPEFERNMKERYGVAHKVLYEVMEDTLHFSTDIDTFHRNTCDLDLTGPDITIDSFFGGSPVEIYESDPLNGLSKLRLDLQGEDLHEAVGTVMAKCFGKVLPSASIFRQPKHEGSEAVKMVCTNDASKAKYELAEIVENVDLVGGDEIQKESERVKAQKEKEEMKKEADKVMSAALPTGIVKVPAENFPHMSKGGGLDLNELKDNVKPAAKRQPSIRPKAPRPASELKMKSSVPREGSDISLSSFHLPSRTVHSGRGRLPGSMSPNVVISGASDLAMLPEIKTALRPLFNIP
eukprot:GHVO01069754.1.p1 GENE.GHVO01069754.1~~GHVO01069754.1.p1  ORF type:complete len:491 (+),score=99.38 GHVO01069754.1:113-1585(+)